MALIENLLRANEPEHSLAHKADYEGDLSYSHMGESEDALDPSIRDINHDAQGVEGNFDTNIDHPMQEGHATASQISRSHLGERLK